MTAICSQGAERYGCCCGAAQCFQPPLKPPTCGWQWKPVLGEGHCLKVPLASGNESVRQINKMLCYVQQTEVLL